MPIKSEGSILDPVPLTDNVIVVIDDGNSPRLGQFWHENVISLTGGSKCGVSPQRIGSQYH